MNSLECADLSALLKLRGSKLPRTKAVTGHRTPDVNYECNR